MIPANLIVNADDFGIDARVSRAIALCLDEGLINSFSVYPFSDPFHEELFREILHRHPGAKVGAHLAVVGPDLKEHPGHFRDVLIRYATGRLTAAEVRELWKAQILALQTRLGGAFLSHLDSHQHLHLLPGLWEAARSLQEEFRIPRLRIPYEGVTRAIPYRFPFGFAMQALARLRADGEKPAFIGFFTSTRFTLAGNRAALDRIQGEPGRRFELMVHPALPQAGSPGTPPEVALAPEQEAELDELRKLAAYFGDTGRPTGN